MSWLLTRIKGNNFYKHLCHSHPIRKIARVAPIRSAASKDAGFLNKLRNVFRQSDYEFSKTKLSSRVIPEVYTEQLGLSGGSLEYIQKAHVNILIKRHMSGMAARTPKPPIREPNMPQRSIRREEGSKKKEKKEKKKPVMYVQGADDAFKLEAPPQSPPTPTEFTRVYRNRWGVRLFEDQKPTVDSSGILTHQLVPVSSPIGARLKLENRRPASSSSSPKLRLALISGDDFEMKQSRVRRPQRELPRQPDSEEQRQLAAQVNQIHEASLPDDEVLAPTEFGAKGLLMAWQYAVVNSHPTKSSLTERQLPSMLGDIEAVFIQPEAPGNKPNGRGVKSIKVKSSPSGQSSAHYSTYSPIGGDTNPADAPKPLSLPSVESFETRESENESMKKFSSDLDSVLELECEKKEKKEEAKAQRKSDEDDDEYDIRDSMKIRHDQKFEFGKYENGVYKRLKMDREKGDTQEIGDDKNIIVKIDGDPYPYSREYFEKWRAPPYKPFNIHRVPTKPRRN